MITQYYLFRVEDLVSNKYETKHVTYFMDENGCKRRKSKMVWEVSFSKGFLTHISIKSDDFSFVKYHLLIKLKK